MRHPISLVIPVLNDLEGLRSLLSAVALQTIRADLEVIVVDNGSSDGSYELATSLSDVAISVPGGNGSSAARNAGLAIASSELLLTTDADCRPVRADWAEQHVTAMADAAENILATAGALLPMPTTDTWAIRRDLTPQPGLRPDGSPAYAVNGSACYRTEMLRWLGGYPDFGANDAAVGRLAAERGLRYLWRPEAAVYHRNPEGAAGYFRQRRKYGYYAAELETSPVSVSRYGLEVCHHLAACLRPALACQFHEAYAQCGGALATHFGAIEAMRTRGRLHLCKRADSANT